MNPFSGLFVENGLICVPADDNAVVVGTLSDILNKGGDAVAYRCFQKRIVDICGLCADEVVEDVSVFTESLFDDENHLTWRPSLLCKVSLKYSKPPVRTPLLTKGDAESVPDDKSRVATSFDVVQDGFGSPTDEKYDDLQQDNRGRWQDRHQKDPKSAEGWCHRKKKKADLDPVRGF